VEPAAHPPRRAADPRWRQADRSRGRRGHPGEDVGERQMRAAAALVLVALADEEEGAVVRVIAEQAEVRTGPGFAYRAIYTAVRGETLKAEKRATQDY